ncbi:MAG: hypothetical protein ACXW1Y_02645 [Acidimicrobiia bacterium]
MAIRPVTDPTRVDTMADHLNRPAVITGTRRRRLHRHLQHASYHIASHHLKIRQIQRHLDTITHLSPPSFVGFVTNRK